MYVYISGKDSEILKGLKEECPILKSIPVCYNIWNLKKSHKEQDLLAISWVEFDLEH